MIVMDVIVMDVKVYTYILILYIVLIDNMQVSMMTVPGIIYVMIIIMAAGVCYGDTGKKCHGDGGTHGCNIMYNNLCIHGDVVTEVQRKLW